MASSSCRMGLLILLAFFIYDQSFVEASCPLQKEEAEAQMKRCLKSVGLGNLETGGTGQQNWVEFKRHCSDGSLDQALNCVKTIVDDCKATNEDIADALNKVISIENLRQGFHYICENLDVLAENSKCMERAQKPMQICVQTETGKFQAKVDGRRQSGGITEDEIWEMTCGLIDGLFTCQHKAFLDECNDQVAEVITTFMQAARPPVCKSQMQGGTTSINSSSSIKLVFSTLFFLIVLRFRS